MKLNDDLLTRAAIISRNRALALLPSDEECPVYEFSDEILEQIAYLGHKIESGELKDYAAPLGMPYYIRRSIAAVLIGFLLTFATAPEAVMAGYHKLVEIIREVVTEYTDFEFVSNNVPDCEFKQVTFGYIPTDFTTTTEEIRDIHYFAHYTDGNSFINITQTLLENEYISNHLIDTEETEIQYLYINGDEVKLIFNKNKYRYLWVHDNYLIRGQSNLPLDEIMKILENITFE